MFIIIQFDGFLATILLTARLLLGLRLARVSNMSLKFVVYMRQSFKAAFIFPSTVARSVKI